MQYMMPGARPSVILGVLGEALSDRIVLDEADLLYNAPIV